MRGLLPYVLVASSTATNMQKAVADYYCDGTEDDIEIQLAIDSLPATGGKVQLTDGTFNINTPLFPKNYTVLCGMGMTTTILKGTATLGSSVITRTDGSPTPVPLRTTTAAPSIGIQLSDFKIDGSIMLIVDQGLITAQGGKGIFMRFLSFATFENIWIYRTPATGFGSDAHKNCTYINCIATECGQCQKIDGTGEYVGCHGFGIGTSEIADESLTVTACTARDNIHAGIALESTGSTGIAKQMCITNCVSEQNKYGFEVRDIGLGNITEVKISGCQARNNTLHGLYVWIKPQYLSIYGNIFIANGGNGAFFNNTGSNLHRLNSIFANNICSNNTGHGIASYSGSLNITGNLVSGNAGRGIFITPVGGQVYDILINGNTVLDNGRGGTTDDGIRIEGGASYATLNITCINNRCADDSALYSLTMTNVARASNIATVTTAYPHGFVTGQRINVNAVDAAYDNATAVITTSASNPKTFTYANAGADEATKADAGTASPLKSQRYGIIVTGSTQGLHNSFFANNNLIGNLTGAFYYDNANGSFVTIYNNTGTLATATKHPYDTEFQTWLNSSGGGLTVGQIVVRLAGTTGQEVTTTVSAADRNILGVAAESISNAAWGRIQTLGKTISLKVNGTIDIAIGDYICTYSSAGIGRKAAAGEVAIAIALEAYTTDDSNGIIDALIIPPFQL
jgi:hypothetical protein